MQDTLSTPVDRNAPLDILLADRAGYVAVAQRVLRCRARAEDVVQEAALRLWQAQPADLHSPAGYVRRMVRNLAIDAVRQVSVECRLLARASAADALASPCACPQARMESCEALRAVVARLGTAPERTRRAMLAHRIEGVPQKTIAQELRVSPTLVNFMIRDATALCRQALEESDTRASALATAAA